MRLKSIIPLALLLVPSLAHAKNWVLVLPDSFAGDKEQLAEQIADFGNRLGQDDRLLVLGGARLRQLSTTTRPSGENAANPAWVRRKIEESLSPTMEFIEAMPATASNGGQVAAMPVSDVLGELGQNIVSNFGGDKSSNVLLLASFKMSSPGDPAMSMTDNYPSDDTLRLSPQASVYGVAGLDHRLVNVTVHWCGANGESEFTNHAQAVGTKRFLTKWLRAQGALVGTISTLIPTCFARFEAGQTAGQLDYAAVADGTTEMIKPVTVPAVAKLPEAPPAPVTQKPAPVAPPAVTAPAKQPDAPPPVTRKAAMVAPVETPPGEDFKSCPAASLGAGISWIGINWEARADIDLYVRGAAGRPWLFYDHKSSSEGTFGHDYRAGTGLQRFEYAQFSKPFDPAKGQALVNLYSGDTKGRIAGTVRVCMDGRIYEGPFTITARHGNKGAGPTSLPQWTRLDLKRIVSQSPLRAER